MTDKLLVIDDDEQIVSSLKQGLEAKGFGIDAYDDPVQAVQDYRAGVYDLVLCDIHMPNKSGFDVYRELKKLDPSVRVCFFTAFEVYQHEFNTMFPELEAECFLRKPMPISELANKVGALIERNRPMKARPNA